MSDNVTPIRPDLDGNDPIEPEEGVLLTPQWMWTPNDVTQILVTIAVLSLVVGFGAILLVAFANAIV